MWVCDSDSDSCNTSESHYLQGKQPVNQALPNIATTKLSAFPSGTEWSFTGGAGDTEKAQLNSTTTALTREMNTRCPPKRVPSADRFFSLCRPAMQPPQSYSVGGQRNLQASPQAPDTYTVYIVVRQEEKMQLQEQQRQKERLERLERQRLQQEQLERERLERERLERLECERLERERLERERLERERLEERLEHERLERERLERERLERERLERERLEERLERERLERERLEHERLERERLEHERLERERLEHERLERERLEHERLERERQEKEQQERDQQEQLEREQMNWEREQRMSNTERERLERERQEKEQQERDQQEQLEREQMNWEREQRMSNTAPSFDSSLYSTPPPVYSSCQAPAAPPPSYSKAISTPVSTFVTESSVPDYISTSAPASNAPPTPPLRHSASRFATSLGSAFHPVLPHYATVPRPINKNPAPPSPVIAPPPAAPSAKSIVWSATNFSPLPPSPPVMISSPPGKATGPRPVLPILVPSPLTHKPSSPTAANCPPDSPATAQPVLSPSSIAPPLPPPPPPPPPLCPC
ncbi:UNVERIFIED_CONTAM: hypothetical protein FKN15_072358 [Acipenser sinensis]